MFEKLHEKVYLLCKRDFFCFQTLCIIAQSKLLPILFSFLRLSEERVEKEANAVTASEAVEVIAIIPQLAVDCSGRTWFQAVLKAIDSISNKDVIFFILWGRIHFR